MTMKINLYDKLYFLFYSLLSKVGKYDLGFKAMMLFSAIIFANVLTVIYLIYDKSNLEWLATYFGVIVVCLPILIFNYFYFVYNHRYKKISEIMGSGKYANIIIPSGISIIIITVVLLLLVIKK
jgi:hypothetical protein